jgi:hypothetical protein
MRTLSIAVILASMAWAPVPALAQTPEPTASPTAEPSPAVDRRLAKILATGDGKSADTAYKVGSVADEYAILRILNLQLRSQSLITGKKPYDRIDAVDRATGETRAVWFDISRFFGRMF